MKMTLLPVNVSVTGNLKYEISISFQISESIGLESVKTTLLLQDDRNRDEVNIKMGKKLFVPFIIESSVLSLVRIPVIWLFNIGRIKPCQAVIL